LYLYWYETLSLTLEEENRLRKRWLEEYPVCNFSLNLTVNQFVLFTIHNYGNQIKENEMGMQAGHVR
jgi:hypothetical protein